MPHHRRVLRKAWNRLRPGGRVVIMDAKLPPGRGGEMILPFSLWLMKRTMLGNPLIQPWTEIVARTEHFNMREYLLDVYKRQTLRPFRSAGFLTRSVRT